MVKNIIVISIDDLRYDCVSYQNDKDELKRFNCLQLLDTPTLDQISSLSTCFTNAFSVSTYTSSAHASLFTALYPPKHGVREFFRRKLNPNVRTLAEICKENGYTTIMATDTSELFVPLGLTRGFDTIIERNDTELFSVLEKVKNKNKFLFVHFFDVHEPYMFSQCPPDQKYNEDYYQLILDLKRRRYKGLKSFRRFFRNIYSKIDSSMDTIRKMPYGVWKNFWNDIERPIQEMLPIYVKGVSKFDKGRFRIFWHKLKKMGLLEDTLAVILSDHGEGRCRSYQKTFFGHAGELYDDVIRIPLILYYSFEGAFFTK